MLRKFAPWRVLQAGVTWFFGSPWPSFTILFVLSLAIRVDQLTPLPYWAIPSPNPQREIGRIATSVAQTGEFANPYALPTGPTAHVPPVYPYILGGLYRLFGLTRTAGYVSYLLIAVVASLLYALLPWVSNRLGLGRAAGFIGGLIGGVQIEERWLHAEDLMALVLLLLLAAFLVRWTTRQVSWQGSLLLGLGMGVAFHLQPAYLPVMLACMAFELWWLRGPHTRTLVGVMILGAALACIPWAWRNYVAFHELFFIRSNLGLELRMGNNVNAEPTMEAMDRYGSHIHPTLLETEARAVIKMGEAAYMRRAGQEALDWIAAHPRDFLWLTVRRVGAWWLGPWYRPAEAAPVTLLTILALCGAWLMWRRLSMPQRGAFIIPLLTYPLIYYVVAYMPNYRAPIDWILFILAGAAISGLWHAAAARVAGSQPQASIVSS
jgi:hypothetical protein